MPMWGIICSVFSFFLHTRFFLSRFLHVDFECMFSPTSYLIAVSSQILCLYDVDNITEGHVARFDISGSLVATPRCVASYFEAGTGGKYQTLSRQANLVVKRDLTSSIYIHNIIIYE